MKIVILPTLLLLSLGSSSCTVANAHRMMVSQGQTSTDILYEEILDNVAMLRAAPGALPWHITVTKGSSSSQGTAAVPFSYGWPNITHSLGLSASYQQQTSWDITPFDDPDFLRVAIRKYNEIKEQGWIQEGRRPPTTPGVEGNYKGHYVWVDAKNYDKLTEVALKLLDAEQTEKSPPSGGGGGSSGGHKIKGISPKIQAKIMAPSPGNQMLIRPQ